MFSKAFLTFLYTAGLLSFCLASRSSKSKSSEESWEVGEITYVDVDLTLTEASAGADVVDATLDTIDLTCIFQDDKLLVRRMAAALTNDGRDEETYIGGAEGGIWNVTTEILELTMTSPELELYRRDLKYFFGIDWTKVTLADMTKPLFSALATKLYLETITSSLPRTMTEQAELVAEHFFPATSDLQSDFVENLEDRKDEICYSVSLDIVLVIDGSGSVTSESFDKVRNFAGRFLDAVDLGSDYTRVGVVQYSNDAQVEFYLDEYFDKEEAKTAVGEIRYLRGSTDTAAALRLTAQTMFSAAHGARVDNSGIPKVAIVLTDGQSNDPADTGRAARVLREAGVSVFAVGIGKDVDVSELNAIASDPDCSHVFELAGFDEVIDFVEQIKQTACKEPAQLEIGSEIIATLNPGQKMFATFTSYVDEGVKIDLSTRKGEVKAYLSTKTKNPNSASHEWRCRGTMNERGRCFIPPGQLKKLVRRDNTEIQLYLTFTSNEEEMARFYAMLGTGASVQFSFILLLCLTVFKLLL